MICGFRWCGVTVPRAGSITVMRACCNLPRTVVERVPGPGVTLLVAGGLAYTLGVVFFALDSRIRYAHAVWHAFVIAGSGFHFFAVLHYAV